MPNIEQFEKTRKKGNFFRKHPLRAKAAIHANLKKTTTVPPQLQCRKLHFTTLVEYSQAARDTLRHLGIGDVEVVALSVRAGRMVVEIAHFTALDRIRSADVIGHCDSGQHQLVSLECGSQVRVVWKRRSSLGLLECQTNPGDGHE